MNAALDPFAVHTAGPPIDWVQWCAACGWPVVDNTAWVEGRVAVPASDDGCELSWFPVGARVATDKPTPTSGGMTYLLAPESRRLADDERLCAGNN